MIFDFYCADIERKTFGILVATYKNEGVISSRQNDHQVAPEDRSNCNSSTLPYCILIRSPWTVTTNVLLIVHYVAVWKCSDMGTCLGTGYVLGGVFDKTFIR